MTRKEAQQIAKSAEKAGYEVDTVWHNNNTDSWGIRLTNGAEFWDPEQYAEYLEAVQAHNKYLQDTAILDE